MEGTQFSILPHTRVQAANNNWGKYLTGPREFGDPGLSYVYMCLASEPPPPNRTPPHAEPPLPNLLPVPGSMLRVSFLSVTFRQALSSWWQQAAEAQHHIFQVGA
ncbi:hypothetical protein ACRRTK_016243 [Alexandromys fortis]